MPNVTWQEPQVLVDLLAMNLVADRNKMALRGPRMIAVVSPWLSDVEIGLHAGAWHQQITVGEATSASLQKILAEYCRSGWETHVAVLAYGINPSGIDKPADKFAHERRLLKRLIQQGALVHLVPDLHAKGIVTPLGVITGSTNITNSGLYAQAQNANYFAHDHVDYEANRIQLNAKFLGTPVTTAL
jgi:phosphatidylserine/phosphatidylglycerophosphate/cardiolipin synthase-like enzyme